MTAGWRRATVGGAMALMLATVACGGGGTTTASPAAPGGLATTPGGPAGGGGTGPTGTSGATGTSALSVTQNNFQFDPTKIKVKSGSTITVQNLNGTTPHTFTIKSSNIDVVNDHGQTSQVKIDLPPGTYTFFCRFHVSLGMKGTLVVT